MELREELKKLYMASSKHSGYQILPKELADILDIQEDIRCTYEKERFDFICKNISLKDKNVLDIGGNTGYFTFECAKQGCRHIDYYEGNPLHAEFVRKAKPVFNADNVEVHAEYYMFEDTRKSYDIALCLNVVHHLGDDFLSAGNIELAKKKMIDCINQLSYSTDELIFQMGFNWRGNSGCCLFENGTKQEMEEYILNGTKNDWEIESIGIAEKVNDYIVYNVCSESNNVRMDELGEFLNRPIFIMKSKRINNG